MRSGFASQVKGLPHRVAVLSVSRPLQIVWSRCSLAQMLPHPSHSPDLGRLGPSGHRRFVCGMGEL